MRIACEMCGTENWKMVIHEVSFGGKPVGGVVYSALRCESCGMIYPIQELAKATGARVSRDAVIQMLRQ